MKQITFDLRRMNVIDVSKLVPLRSVPHRALPAGEQAFVKTAFEFGKLADPGFKLLLAIEELAEKPNVAVVFDPLPALTTLGPAGAPPFSISVSRKKDVTVSAGGGASAGIVGGVAFSYGFYASSTKEVGFFVTGGGVFGLIIGASAGPELAYIMGGPSDFSGLFFGLAASVSPLPPPLAVFGVGATLLFSAGPLVPVPIGSLVPPSLRGLGLGAATISIPLSLVFMGIAVNLSAGISELPVSIVVEATNTTAIPLIHLR
jgi:hypothetical protein